MSSSVSIFLEAVLFSPKKAGVMSPPPGKIKASHPDSSPRLRVVRGVAGILETNLS